MEITAEMMEKAQIESSEKIKKFAEDLLSVQPMDPTLFAKLINDPLANQLANNFVNRLTGKSN